ncbi:Protein DEHYDRATION-INDUCED 19-like protein 5 [Dichanthelium oligosanthes]|uniref:Protein DEHYDRATION-INDUCED 19-like protein 5 n=1 Tax=Dichanthelium oligosanthes TaxID=888268 RepID=A0A1E5UJ17_9POAL|nr:Protein DEHYDRATION-INDUCED 19-like protein 5 [Dichanthelium oligosanthes]
MEVEACYNYGFLPAGRGRHQPPPPPPYGHGPPPPHPAAVLTNHCGFIYSFIAEDGELWEYFPCPFCYIEVEVPFICNHLQEEHCFDTRNAVCPICANNLGKDMAAHFRVQHSHLLKRRKPSKPSSWPAAATNSASGKGTATYQVNSYFEESQHYRSSRPYQEPAPDPLLSQFICSVEQSDDAIPGDASAENGAVKIPDDQRKGASDDASSKLGLEERLQRIDFLSEILMSTIL